ncbi:hypothetical protein [Methanococcoides seepicolus]|jgi:hypothetical protein|uniref:CARDB domain-containing protein n=1 Tax=Methanococcoides seepicolus TaxID=2828780 RepID=A0A9E4ZHP5_9EURY|nr:hypothetical protein [Methanococcoides seepicolus]MCM1987811.1 hypothetical protein [Methanococcoides seepicolus]
MKRSGYIRESLDFQIMIKRLHEVEKDVSLSDIYTGEEVDVSIKIRNIGTKDATVSFIETKTEHVRLAGGVVPINNYHLLLFTWSTIIGIILYTEFLTWYLSKKKRSN